MSKSNIRKTELVIRAAGSDNKLGGQRSRIALNKEGLLSEHRINVRVSQANTLNDPASCDVRKFIKNIELQTTDGKRFSGDGFLAYDLNRLTEKMAAPVIVLGATSTAEFSFELHHELDGALHDLITAIRGGLMGQLDLVIDWADDANNGFIGQTGAGVASYAASVTEKNYPAMVAVNGVGMLKQFVESQPANGTTTGRQGDMRLAGENSTRFVVVHAFDNATGLPSDAVMDNVSIVIKGEEKRIVTWREMRDAAAARDVDVIGLGLLDWGDDEAGFLDLMTVNDPRLQYVIAAGAPAAWRVHFGQVFVKR